MNGVPKDTKPHLTYNFIMNFLNISSAKTLTTSTKKKYWTLPLSMQKGLVLSCLHKQKILVAMQEKKTSKIKSKIKKSIATSTVEEKNIPQDTYQKLIDELRFLQPQ